MRTSIVGSFILSTAAAIVAAQSISADDKSGPPMPSKGVLKKIDTSDATPKTKFDIDEVKKLVLKLDNDSYSIREQASSKLSEMPKTLSFEGLNDFLIYILDEGAKPTSLEVSRRLERVQGKIYTTLKQTVASQSKSPKRTEVPLKLIEILEKKRSVYVWKELTPVVVDIIANEATISETFYDEHAGSESVQMKLDSQLIAPLSKLLLSAFDKDSKELQAEATKLIVSLTKPPLREQEIFTSLHNMKLKALTALPENKLSEIEKGLKELKALYLQADLANGLEANLAQSAKPYLGKILEINVDAFSTNDLKKQEIAMGNINVLKDQFNNPRVKDLVSTKNGALIFNRREEFSKNITNSKELQSSIAIARFISELSKDDTSYHKNYVSWLEKQIDNPALQKLPDREDMQNTLEYALLEELYTVSRNGSYTFLQAEIISPLVKTYTKLSKQNRLDSKSSLEKHLGAIIDFQSFSHFYLQLPEREKLHPDLLDLFDDVTDGINKLKDTKDKSLLRSQVATVLPHIHPKGHKDYIDRLSTFYCEEKDLNINEFMSLADSLLNSPDSEHIGKYLPPKVMLQFIENNPKYFEKNIQHIIETYKKLTVPAVKSTAGKQLQTLYLSFHRLFNEGRKAKTSDGWLTQVYPSTQVVNTSTSSGTNLKYLPDGIEQISRIETWFNRRLEKSVTEILSLEGR